MSSRLFQEVREKRGLCYAIYSTAWGLRDAGLFGIHAATGTGLMGQLIDVIGAELKRAADTPPAAAELARSKAQLKAGLLMSLESSSARAEQVARHILTHNRVIGNEELMAKVDAVTAADVREFAGELLQGGLSVSVVGSGRRSRKFAERAAEMTKR
jgi:predicted Zn-dependent peptidase